MVIDMPLLDTRIEGKNLVGKFISDIVLQVLSFVAQSKRETMRVRQAEGIKTAKTRAVKFSKPRITLPNNFEIVQDNIKNGNNKPKTYEILGMTHSSFFKHMKE